MKASLTKRFAVLGGIMLVVMLAVAATNVNNKISRLTTGLLVIGGTNTTSGTTVVVSDAKTNEYRVVFGTATVSGSATTYSNNFSPVFTTTPVMVWSVATAGTNVNYALGFTTRLTSSNLFVTTLSTNLVTGTNSVQFLLYGTTRSGILE